jgi:hypothetical protein
LMVPPLVSYIYGFWLPLWYLIRKSKILKGVTRKRKSKILKGVTINSKSKILKGVTRNHKSKILKGVTPL